MQNHKKPRTQTNLIPLMQSQSKIQRLALSAFLLAAGLATTPAFAAIAPPSAPNMADASDSGNSATDNVTNVQQPLFSGTGKPFSAVTLFAGTTQVGFGIVPPSGQWIAAPNVKLKDGSYVMTARQTAGGVQSAPSSPLNITIDTVSPAAPSQPDMTAGSDHGSSVSDNITNTTTPTFQGFANPGDFIALYDITLSSLGTIGTAKTSAQGIWQDTVQSPFPSGTHSYQIAARASDLAGNISPFSSALAVRIDTDKPAPPSTPDLVTADDSGASSTDNITKVTLPTFTVKAEPSAQVELRDFATKKLIGTGTAGSTGIATIKAIAPLTGNYSLYAIAFDTSGNQAQFNPNTLLLTVDTTAPDVLGKPVLDSSSDSGFLGDGITSDTTPVVGGFSATPGPLTINYSDGVSTHQVMAQVKSTHLWSLTLPVLADGVYDVTSTNTDLAGNSSVSPVSQITIDTKAPAAPTRPSVNGNDYGVSATDHITDGDSFDFSGNSEAAASVELYNGKILDSTTLLGVDTADYKGEWEIKKKFYQGGPLQVSAVAIDAAGNRSVPSPQFIGLLDLTNPVADVTTPSGQFIQNFAGLSGTTSDSVVNGDASGIDKVMYRLSGDAGIWSGTAWISYASGGNLELPTKLAGNKWSVPSGLPIPGANPLTQLKDGDYKITLISYDKAGNEGVSMANFTVDNVAPTVSIMTPSANALLSGFPSVTGTADDYHKVAQVKLKLQRTRGGVTSYWNGSAFTTNSATVNATLTLGSAVWNWTKQLPQATDLDAGVYTLTAYAYDSAGNVTTSPGRSFNLSGSNASTGTRPSNSAGIS